MRPKIRLVICGFKLTQCLLAVMLLVGCGQSGNLFLPTPAEVINPANSPTAEASSKSEAEPSAED